MIKLFFLNGITYVKARNLTLNVLLKESDRLPLLLAMVSPFPCVWLFDQTGPLGRPLKRANVKEDRFSH